MKDVLEQQKHYYDARSLEYDEWFFRQGRFDWGEQLNDIWHDEIKTIRTIIAPILLRRKTLEIACGTGNYTHVIASLSSYVTALDASQDMLEQNKKKNFIHSNIEYIQGDAMSLNLQGTYDIVFMSHWLSHVPRNLLSTFFDSLVNLLSDNGQIVIVDQLRENSTTAKDQPLQENENEVHTRLLNSGDKYSVIKNYYTKQDIVSALGDSLLLKSWTETERYFYIATIGLS